MMQCMCVRHNSFKVATFCGYYTWIYFDCNLFTKPKKQDCNSFDGKTNEDKHILVKGATN